MGYALAIEVVSRRRDGTGISQGKPAVLYIRVSTAQSASIRASERSVDGSPFSVATSFCAGDVKKDVRPCDDYAN